MRLQHFDVPTLRTMILGSVGSLLNLRMLLRVRGDQPAVVARMTARAHRAMEVLCTAYTEAELGPTFAEIWAESQNDISFWAGIRHMPVAADAAGIRPPLLTSAFNARTHHLALMEFGQLLHLLEETIAEPGDLGQHRNVYSQRLRVLARRLARPSVPVKLKRCARTSPVWRRHRSRCRSRRRSDCARTSR